MCTVCRDLLRSGAQCNVNKVTKWGNYLPSQRQHSMMISLPPSSPSPRPHNTISSTTLGLFPLSCTLPLFTRPQSVKLRKVQSFHKSQRQHFIRVCTLHFLHCSAVHTVVKTIPNPKKTSDGSRQIGPRTIGPRTVGPRGPVVRGPTVRGPICRGPICLEPSISFSIWDMLSNS